MSASREPGLPGRRPRRQLTRNPQRSQPSRPVKVASSGAHPDLPLDRIRRTVRLDRLRMLGEFLDSPTQVRIVRSCPMRPLAPGVRMPEPEGQEPTNGLGVALAKKTVQP